MGVAMAEGPRAGVAMAEEAKVGEATEVVERAVVERAAEATEVATEAEMAVVARVAERVVAAREAAVRAAVARAEVEKVVVVTVAGLRASHGYDACRLHACGLSHARADAGLCRLPPCYQSTKTPGAAAMGPPGSPTQEARRPGHKLPLTWSGWSPNLEKEHA